LNLAKRGVAEEAEMGEEQLMVKVFLLYLRFLVNIKKLKTILRGE
jgi:hypothetical protein